MSAFAGSDPGSWDASVSAAVVALQEWLPVPTAAGLILGSGMADVAMVIEQPRTLRFSDVPGLGAVGVEGHRGELVSGSVAGVSCLALLGRRHAYEGHSAVATAFAARVLCRLGIRALVVTNAAGSLRPGLEPGDLLIIDDHINLQWRSPLAGPVPQRETRFPDMSEPYDRRLQALAERVALAHGLSVTRGVYLAALGPSYETPAEIRMFQRIGADAIGMSTVPEVLAARAAGVPVLGLSLITNLAAGLAPAPLAHEEVIAAGASAAGSLRTLLRGVIAGMPAALAEPARA